MKSYINCYLFMFFSFPPFDQRVSDGKGRKDNKSTVFGVHLAKKIPSNLRRDLYVAEPIRNAYN